MKISKVLYKKYLLCGISLNMNMNAMESDNESTSTNDSQTVNSELVAEAQNGINKIFDDYWTKFPKLTTDDERKLLEKDTAHALITFYAKYPSIVALNTMMKQ